MPAIPHGREAGAEDEARASHFGCLPLWEVIVARWTRKALSVIAISAVALAATPQVASAAESATVPDLASAADTVSHSGLVARGSGGAQNEAINALLCVFTTHGDYVHISSSAFEASGHGWWVNGNCNATYAVVTVQLQQKIGGQWRNAGPAGKATVRSGGGSGNRATGRAACNSSTVTEWRSIVDVDLVGVLDDPGKLVTPTRTLACRH